MVAESFTPGRTGSSHLLEVDAGWEGDSGRVFGSYLDVGEDFVDEMGFLPRVGIRKYSGSGYLAWRPEWRGVRQWFLGNDHQYFTDRHGRVQSQNNSFGPAIVFHNGAVLFGGWQNTAEGLTEPFEIREGIVIPEGTYRFDEASVQYLDNRSRAVSLSGGLTVGGFYDGRIASLNLAGRVRPHGRLTLEIEYFRNRVRLPWPGPGESTFSTNW